MSAFTGSLLIEEVKPGRRWRLVSPIRYEAERKGSGLWIEVPAGFETDGASIPAALRVVLAVWGSYGRAAALHDYLYSLIRAGEQRGLWAIMPGINPPCAGTARRWADTEFYVAMCACGTSRPLAWAIWAAVRLFGGKYCRPPSDAPAGIKRADASGELAGDRGVDKAECEALSPLYSGELYT